MFSCATLPCDWVTGFSLVCTPIAQLSHYLLLFGAKIFGIRTVRRYGKARKNFLNTIAYSGLLIVDID